MSNVLKHRYTSPKLDGADTQQVQPSHWNDGHRFEGGAAGDMLTRDPTDATFGAKWTPPPVAAVAASTWVPTDASGGGLVLTNGGCKRWKFEKLVILQGWIIWPSTALGTGALFSGFPDVNTAATHGGLYVTNAPMPMYLNILPGTAYVNLINPAGSVSYTNAQMSGVSFKFAGTYLTD